MAESNSELPALGVAVPDFLAGVQTLVELRDEHRYLVYLIKDYWINLVGDRDDFALDLSKKLKDRPFERKYADTILDEIKLYLQTSLVTGSPVEAARFLCTQFYETEIEEIRESKGDEAASVKGVEEKFEFVFKLLRTAALIRKRRRAATATGALLQDVDIDGVSTRHVAGEPIRAIAPFINLHFKYLKAESSGVGFPPWVGSLPHSTNTFSLECDEGELDLMIMRLTLAKSVLAKSIQESAKLNPDEPGQK